MLRKYVNDKKLTNLLVLVLITTQVLAFVSNGFKFYPKFQLRFLLMGLLTYAPLFVAYIYALRALTSSIMLVVTGKIDVSITSILSRLGTKYGISIAVSSIFIWKFDFFAKMYIKYIHKIITNVPTNKYVQQALLTTEDFATNLLVISLAAIAGYIGFNLWTKNLAKYRFVRREIIRPIDDLLKMLPLFAVPYFLYILAMM